MPYGGKWGEGCQGVDKGGRAWEITHVSSIVTCDSRRRIVVEAAVPGWKYLVDGLKITPVADLEPQREPIEWAGSKMGIEEHMKALYEDGFEMPAPLQEEVKPGRI